MEIADQGASWVTTILVAVLMFVLADTWKRRSSRCWTLPGPTPWPLVGNMPHIWGKSLHQALTDLGEKYGELFGMRLGTEDVLVVNSMDATVDTFVRQGKVFSGRPAKRKSVVTLLGNGVDIVMNDIGKELKFHRKIVHSFLASQLGHEKQRLTDILTEEAESLVEDFHKYEHDKAGFDPKIDISRVVANVLCQSILDRRFERADEHFQDQLQIVQDIVDSIENFNIVDIIPWLEHFPIPSWVRFKQSLARKERWVNQVIQEHRETLGSTDRDLLDVLLRLQKDAREHGNQEHLDMLSDTTIGHIVYELFGGGIESTTMTILWFLIYMIHYPEWQERIAAEVRNVSKERGGFHPFEKGHYPLLEAAIKETLRLATVLLVGFPHKVMADTLIRDYFVPKNTMVIMNIWAIHHDENTWQEPFKFDPARFLSNGEKIYRRGYIPFGIGGRVCLGSNVAKMEVFMFCANILANFRVSSPEGAPLPELSGSAGLTHRPKSFNVRIEPRIDDVT